MQGWTTTTMHGVTKKKKHKKIKAYRKPGLREPKSSVTSRLKAI